MFKLQRQGTLRDYQLSTSKYGYDRDIRQLKMPPRRRTTPQHPQVFLIHEGVRLRLTLRSRILQSLFQNQPRFVKFHPPLQGDINAAYCKSLSYQPHVISFVLYKIDRDVDIDLAPGTIYTIEISRPIPYSLPFRRNLAVTSRSQQCCFCVFIRNPNNHNLEFLTFFDATLSAFSAKLLNLLPQNLLVNSSYLRVGSFGNGGHMPEFFQNLSDFSARISNGRKQMAILVTFETEIVIRAGTRSRFLSELPRRVKPIAAICCHLLQYETEEIKYASVRRLLVVALNWAISLAHLDALKFLFSRVEVRFHSECFHRTRLVDHLEALVPEAASKFEHAVTNFDQFLRMNSNESTLFNFVWSNIFTAAFKNHVYQHDFLKFLPVQEWQARTIFPAVELNRKVDFAVVIESLSDAAGQSIAPCPVFLIEAGVDVAERNLEHKDQTKLSCMMGACCIHLCKLMNDAGKKPEFVRVYGLLIGGTNARILMARPVITRLNGNNCEIHVIITSNDSDCFDLLDSTIHMQVFDEPAGITAPTIRITGETGMQLATCEMFEQNLEPSQNMPTIPSLNTLRSFELTTTPAPSQSQARLSVLYDSAISAEALRKCQNLTEMVKARISLMRSPSSVDPERRNFHQRTDPGILYSSSGSSCSDSTSRGRVTAEMPMRAAVQVESRNSVSQNLLRGTQVVENSPTVISLNKKACESELRINRQLSGLFPAYFPKLYRFKQHSGRITYYFEKMTPFWDMEQDNLNKRFLKDFASQITRECAKMLMECSFALHLLHTQAGIVHSDISPANIMYSHLNKTWKLIDYGQSMPLEESSNTSRIAGTRNFIAPESVETGIFTPQSDIYALGKVCMEFFCCMLAEFYLSSSHTVCRSVSKLNGCFAQMSDEDPAHRSSLVEVMKVAFDVLQLLADHDLRKSKNQVIIAVRQIIEETHGKMN